MGTSECDSKAKNRSVESVMETALLSLQPWYETGGLLFRGARTEGLWTRENTDSARKQAGEKCWGCCLESTVS